jgi:ABC-type phosphate transport system substrate-binding protein
MNKRKFAACLAGLACTLALAAQAMAGDIVVIMAPNAAPLSKEQVANVYLGRALDFKPVDLPESSGTRNDFYKKATDRDAAQVKAAWARLMFTGHGQPPKVMADAAAVKKAVAADPKSVGYIDKADVDSTVKVVLTLN